MWGKVAGNILDMILIGITPTHVGKWPVIAAISAAERDHPHPCGEMLLCLLFHRALKGSPPPMWGNAMFNLWVFFFA